LHARDRTCEGKREREREREREKAREKRICERRIRECAHNEINKLSH